MLYRDIACYIVALMLVSLCHRIDSDRYAVLCCVYAGEIAQTYVGVQVAGCVSAYQLLVLDICLCVY